MSRKTGGGTVRSAAAAAAYLEGLINFERRPGFSYARLGLDPIRAPVRRDQRRLSRRPDLIEAFLHKAGLFFWVGCQ